jgi:hypothetical protein
VHVDGVLAGNDISEGGTLLRSRLGHLIRFYISSSIHPTIYTTLTVTIDD